MTEAILHIDYLHWNGVHQLTEELLIGTVPRQMARDRGDNFYGLFCIALEFLEFKGDFLQA
jgi:hypothetical protein